MEEPTNNNLEELLKTTRNRVDIALMMLQFNRHELLYTALEDIAYGVQLIVDRFCVKEGK